jgi:magnesium-transporting ATPase (P-type)
LLWAFLVLELLRGHATLTFFDDSIQSMAKAALWGRNVYESFRKFLQFQLVFTVVAVSPTVISAIAGIQLPLKPVPLRWANRVMDSMAPIALATEPARQGVRVGQSIGIGHVNWRGWIASFVLGIVVIGVFFVVCWVDE